MDQEYEVGKVYNIKGEGRYRYKGGDPTDRASWEPVVVGAPAQGRPAAGDRTDVTMSPTPLRGGGLDYASSVTEQAPGLTRQFGTDILSGMTGGFSEALTGPSGAPPELSLPTQLVGSIAPSAAIMKAFRPLTATQSVGMPGLLSRLGGNMGIGATEGALFGAGGSPENRIGGGLMGGVLGGTIGLGATSLGEMLGFGKRMVNTLTRGPDATPEQLLYGAADLTPARLSQINREAPTLADALGDQGTELTKAIGRSLSPQDATRIRSGTMTQRRQDIPRRVEEAADELMPGTSPGARTAGAKELYATLEGVPVDDESIIQIVGKIDREGGAPFIGASLRGGRTEGTPLTWDELKELERRLRMAKRPDAANPLQRSLRDLHDELRTAMDAAENSFGEAQRLYRMGKAVEPLDDAARTMRIGMAPSEPGTVRVGVNDKTLGKIESAFGSEARENVERVFQALSSDESLNRAIDQSTRAAFRAGAKDEGIAETALTVAGYAGNNMYGAAFRTLIQRALRGDRHARRAAREVLALMLEDATGDVVQRLSTVPQQLERARQQSARRYGLLNVAIGQGSGGLLGGG